MATEKPNYWPALDGLRGFAALIVIIFHAHAPWFRGGFLGVDVFFVLSGFLITHYLIKEYELMGRIPFKTFYFRRALRLFPALFLLLVAYNTVGFYFFSNPKEHLVDTLIVLFYAANWTRAFDSGSPNILGHCWSLSIEEQFYLLWPLLLFLLFRYAKNRFKIMWIVLGAALFSAFLRAFLSHRGVTATRLYNGLDTRADALLIGCFSAILLSTGLLNNRKIKQPFTAISTLLPIAGFFVIFFNATSEAKWMMHEGYLLTALFSSFVIIHLVTLKNTLLHRVLELSWLVWTGKISYGLYLWHYPIMRYLEQLDWKWPQLMAVGIPLTYSAAVASYYLLEKRCLALKEKLPYKHAAINSQK